MNIKKNLLGLAVLTTSLALVGCGGSSSSGNQQTDEDTTPDEPTFPVAFAFSQDPATALDEMKGLPEQAFPAELYNLLRWQLIEGNSTSSTERLSFWTAQNDFTNYQCGAGTFGTIATPESPAQGIPDNSFYVADKTVATNKEELGAYPNNTSTAALFRESILLLFNDCELVDPADPNTVVATINGEVSLVREWVGESSGDNGRSQIIMDNFFFSFGNGGREESTPVDITLNNKNYNLAFGFTDTHVFGEFSQAQQNALNSFEYANPNRSRFFKQRLADNNFKGMYAFDAPSLRIITTPNGGTASQVKFNNFASVFVADLFGSNPSEDYVVSIESPYRGDENADASTIVFGSGEEAETLFIETLSNGGNDPYLSADFAFSLTATAGRLLRERNSMAAFLECPTNGTTGYSSTPSAPLVAGISFLLDGNSEETTRVYVDENNTQTDRDPAAAISTVSHDAACRDGNNGPTKFIPFPGLGGVDYTLPPS